MNNERGITSILLAVAIVAVLAIAAPVLMYFMYNNADADLRNRAAQAQKDSEIVFDNTWKVIKQTAQVADQYAGKFAEIYPQLMEGRYGNERGGALLSFITEANPEFDSSLYQKVSAAIEAERAKFVNAQKRLTAIQKSHRDLLSKAPTKWFVSNTEPMAIKIVTSTKADEAFQAGKEDDVDVF